ncbi:hypothetical protein Hanom_Chr10g00912981 [Helianthus anomalus]
MVDFILSLSLGGQKSSEYLRVVQRILLPVMVRSHRSETLSVRWWCL